MGEWPHLPGGERDLLLARYYDLEYRDYTDDLPFYVHHAQALDPGRELPLLELGCGTGRILIALAQAGFTVVGVDQSEGMLGICRERAAAWGLRAKIGLVRADMRQLKRVNGPFGMAYCAANTFAYLLTSEDQRAMLRSVRARLAQSGTLILDLTPPLPHLLPPSGGEVVHQGSYTDSENGGVVHKFVTAVAHESTQTHRVTVFYDREMPDGTLSRCTHNFAQRWTGRYEMELLLREAGFGLDRLYGSYELDEYSNASDRMIFVARL